MKAISAVLPLALAAAPAFADESPSPSSESSKSHLIPAVEIVAFEAVLNQFDRH
jgi:hypothetical protein